jgi:hypothetical protein
MQLKTSLQLCDVNHKTSGKCIEHKQSTRNRESIRCRAISATFQGFDSGQKSGVGHTDNTSRHFRSGLGAEFRDYHFAWRSVGIYP